METRYIEHQMKSFLLALESQTIECGACMIEQPMPDLLFLCNAKKGILVENSSTKPHWKTDAVKQLLLDLSMFGHFLACEPHHI